MKFLHRSSSKIEFRRELPSFEVEATAVEHIFQRLYSYVFDMGVEGNSVTEMDRPEPNAIFIVDFVKVRMDPRNREIDLDSLIYGKIPELTEDDITKQGHLSLSLQWWRSIPNLAGGWQFCAIIGRCGSKPYDGR
ncbi:hypothetical protein K1719_042531 [Acacia pycnantha]|nr:hypothetical protein K1719_042531 [Acacia pycnantha]